MQKLPSSKLPCNEKQADRKPVGAVVASERTGDQSKSKVQEQEASPWFQPSLKIKQRQTKTSE